MFVLVEKFLSRRLDRVSRCRHHEDREQYEGGSQDVAHLTSPPGSNRSHEKGALSIARRRKR